MRTIWILASLTTAILSAGCSSDTQLSKAEEDKMRDALEAGKGEFDINKVPPEMREKVRGIIESQKGGGGPAAPPAPK